MNVLISLFSPALSYYMFVSVTWDRMYNLYLGFRADIFSYSALKASLLSSLFSPFLFVQSRYGDWFHPIPIHLEELLFFSD